VNKPRTIGLLIEKDINKRRVLTEEELDVSEARLEDAKKMTETSSLRDTGMTKPSAKTDTQLLGLSSVGRVRERTIPTDRPLLVGEVSANLLRIQGAT
jgi:hypothetical protein